MPQMTEETLLNELDSMGSDATGNNSTFIRQNEYLLDRYEGNLYGDEIPERSKVISNDVMDVVEADMPSLARIFLGPGEILKFNPNKKGSDEDVEEAESKTKYVNWQVREQPWSFSVLHGFIKNALIEKVSVVKYFIEENTEIEEHKKTGLSNEELAIFEESLQGEDVKSVEIVREEEGDDDVNSIVIRVERTVKTAKAVGIPLETFRMTNNATDKDSAPLVGDVSLMTRGELMGMGFSRDIVSSILLAGGDGESNQSENSRLKDIRDSDEGGKQSARLASDWASEEVEVEDLYPLIDFDGDGKLERRHIMRAGDVLLVNEVFNHVPYALMSSILMPHKAIGKSRAEITAPTARIKTAVLRGTMDNIYAVSNPRMIANTNVNADDLLVIRPNGVIRTKGEKPVGSDIMPVMIPYIGDKSLQVIQYLDQSRAQTTGSIMASQGLNADDLGKETATRFDGVQDASAAKVELVARVMAETGFRQLFEGFAWLDSNFQNTATEIEVLGEELEVNPADWKHKHYVVSKVGLGAGDDEKIIQTLTALWALHQQLLASGSPMTDEVKRYNVLKGMVTASGLPEISEFFNDPDKPEELTLAQNEIMTNVIEQLQQQIQSSANPLAEAETIKQQAYLIKAQSDAHMDAAKLQEDQRQFNASLQSNTDKSLKDLALKLTELEAKHGKQLEGEFASNKASLIFDPEIGDFI